MKTDARTSRLAGLLALSCLLIVSIPGMPASCDPPECFTLPVRNFCQRQERWCWAAVAQMVMFYHGSNVSQCAQATVAAGRDCCFDFDERDADYFYPCNEPGYPRFRDYGFDVRENPTPFTWPELRDQIYALREPFVWFYGPLFSSGHMVVVCGYSILDGNATVEVQNPAPWCGDCTRNPNPNLEQFAYDEYAGKPFQGQIRKLDIFATPPKPARPLLPPAYLELVDKRRALLAKLPPDPPTPEDYRTSSNAAQRALAAFSRLGTNLNIRGYGFLDAKELAAAKLGEPLPVYTLAITDLNEPPGEALKPTDSVLYPILVGKEVRCSVTVRKHGESWRLSNFGNPRLSSLLGQALAASMTRSRRPAESYFAVRMPDDLNPYMLAHREDETILLTPLLDDRALSIHAGVDIDAATVFPAILKAPYKLRSHQQSAATEPKTKQSNPQEK